MSAPEETTGFFLSVILLIGGFIGALLGVIYKETLLRRIDRMEKKLNNLQRQIDTGGSYDYDNGSEDEA